MSISWPPDDRGLISGPPFLPSWDTHVLMFWARSCPCSSACISWPLFYRACSICILWPWCAFFLPVPSTKDQEFVFSLLTGLFHSVCPSNETRIQFFFFLSVWGPIVVLCAQLLAGFATLAARRGSSGRDLDTPEERPFHNQQNNHRIKAQDKVSVPGWNSMSWWRKHSLTCTFCFARRVILLGCNRDQRKMSPFLLFVLLCKVFVWIFWKKVAKLLTFCCFVLLAGETHHLTSPSQPV